MKKIFALGILVVFLTAGLSFGQDIYFRGVSWQPLDMEKLDSFDKLGVRLIYLYAGDRDRLAGTIRFLIIITEEGTKYEIIAAWYNPYKLKEMRGCIIRDNGELLLTRTFAEGEILGWTLLNSDSDQGSNPMLIFCYFKKGANPEFVKAIDIKKFVEENFKESPPEK